MKDIIAYIDDIEGLFPDKPQRNFRSPFEGQIQAYIEEGWATGGRKEIVGRLYRYIRTLHLDEIKALAGRSGIERGRFLMGMPWRAKFHFDDSEIVRILKAFGVQTEGQPFLAAFGG